MAVTCRVQWSALLETAQQDVTASAVQIYSTGQDLGPVDCRIACMKFDHVQNYAVDSRQADEHVLS
jgi:hypothetical protein